MIALYTGMRRGEVTHLDWEEIDLSEKTIHIHPKERWHPKNFKDRVIPIPDALIAYLRKLKGKHAGRVVVVGDLSLSMKTIRFLNELGIKGSFHTFRHTYASQMVTAKVDLYIISKILGHSSIRMTEIYAHVNADTLKKSVEKFPY
jgi:integrase